MSQYSPRVTEMFRAAEMSRYSPPNTPQYPDNMARYNSISGPGVDFARYPPEYPHQDRPGFNIRTAHIEAARTQFTDGWRQWPAGPPNMAEVAARAGHVGLLGHVAAISTLYHSRCHQTSHCSSISDTFILRRHGPLLVRSRPPSIIIGCPGVQASMGKSLDFKETF